ncbi:acetyltransferase, ribosomal protein N-acetylase [Corynebacterium mustelae]|uniref:Acetyltransferase, ribosomal protein N-acetylase n=1 Tax=Corynebacterium mustelae TaxID=571915 RepID=A0A0G3GXS4_9CORY|nr:GNAT family protein [Corynebacterium mustelae]AKK05345.1 acetyltransferase, ribosomal protein N-acetylase [Corynebacterium mustelae]
MPIFFPTPKPAVGPRHPLHPGWPEYTATRTIGNHLIRLRPLNKSDGAEWARQRIHDQHILQPVEPTIATDWHTAHDQRHWNEFYKNIQQAARSGQIVPFVIEIDGHFYGQVTIGGIQHGTASDCWIGYWLHSSKSGIGIATAACHLGVDHAFRRIGVHRITATHLPTNPASRRVLEKIGFRQEGYLHRNLHIDGKWRDHYLMALTAEEYINP